MAEKIKQRILIFNVNWLGDVLFSTATIRNIRRNFPDAYIACIIPSRCYQILKDNPYLDEIIIFDDKDRHKGLFTKLNFTKELKYKQFDMVFLLHRSFRRALICRLANIPQRIGYYTRKRGFLLTKKIMPPKKDTLHRADYYLNIIEQAGLKVEDRYLDFFFCQEDTQAVEGFLKKEALKKEDFLVAINPGGNWLPKRWPKEYWARLSDMLIEKFKAKVIITGGYGDLGLVHSISGLMENRPTIAAGIFNIKQLGALCKMVDLFITADTGPLHIASAVHTRQIIAIFGPTSPLITGPIYSEGVVVLQKETGCRLPCYEVHCKDNRCMKIITPEDVLDKIAELNIKR